MPSYILKIANEWQERQLYGKRTFYVGVKREWIAGSKLMFVKKTSDADVFIGLGIIGATFDLDQLKDQEMKMCIKNNWYKKLVFEKLVRFHPEVPVKGAFDKARQNVPLHGASIGDAEISKIEGLAPVKIIS